MGYLTRIENTDTTVRFKTAAIFNGFKTYGKFVSYLKSLKPTDKLAIPCNNRITVGRLLKDTDD